MSKPDDIWQGYTEQGEPTKIPVTVEQAAKGVLHGASHIWIWRVKDGRFEILVQKRADTKRTWPGYYDISAAGHIDFGEMPIVTACREIKEELGFDTQPDDLRLLFVYRENIVAVSKDEVIENEFQWNYSYRMPDNTDLKYADGEVADTIWLSLTDFQKLTEGKFASKKLVPHGKEYFSLLFRELVQSKDMKQ